MDRSSTRFAVAFLFCALSLAGLSSAADAQQPPSSATDAARPIHGGDGITLPAPPATPRHPVTDIYFGTPIVDNYRWLEDVHSAATQQYLQQQTAYTNEYLRQARIRPRIAQDLDGLVHMTQWTIPYQRGDNYFLMRRAAREQQASIYVQHGWPPLNMLPKLELLISPSRISSDPNTSVSLLNVSRDGRLLIYGVRQGGADEEEIHFFDVRAKRDLPDHLPPARYFSVGFNANHTRVIYSRYAPTGTLVFQHRLVARAQSSDASASSAQDTLLFGQKYHEETLGQLDLINARITSDGHYLTITIERGVPARRVDILYRDLRKDNSPFVQLVWGIDSRFRVLYDRDHWYVQTDYKAPKGRILEAHAGSAPDTWNTIVPEGADVIDDASIVGHRLFVHSLHDVNPHTAVYSLTGQPLGELKYNGIGTASGLFGDADARYGFFSFQSMIQPPTIYRFDTRSGKQDIFFQPDTPFDSSKYTVRQVFYTSKDGTRVPMFIAGRKDLPIDGSRRLLMTAYGGFNISETPKWNAQWAEWMQLGGWFAVPSLRGGGEYGESWHEQGMFQRKQNVFDDFYAAAEYLIAHKYTSSEHFAISGRSNGGLLMGAAMTQRPDLFAAIWCGYPLLDMLRYQNFLIGRFWTTEYGSSEHKADFGWLLKYSPYQNVHPGTHYPSILFFTGASDTRVDPLHARKMAALMQASSGSDRPILLHYGLKGGHSDGVSTSQLVQDYADSLAFLWTETGPRQREGAVPPASPTPGTNHLSAPEFAPAIH
jgi:prolyl oligopeptidase